MGKESELLPPRVSYKLDTHLEFLLAFIHSGHDLFGQIEDLFHIAIFRLDHVEILHSRLEPVIRWNVIFRNIDAPRIRRVVDIAELLQSDLAAARQKPVEENLGG